MNSRKRERKSADKIMALLESERSKIKADVEKYRPRELGALAKSLDLHMTYHLDEPRISNAPIISASYTIPDVMLPITDFPIIADTGWNAPFIAELTTHTNKSTNRGTKTYPRARGEQDRAALLSYCRPALVQDWANWLVGYVDRGRKYKLEDKYPLTWNDMHSIGIEDMPTFWVLCDNPPAGVPALYGVNCDGLSLIIPKDSSVTQENIGKTGHTEIYFMKDFTFSEEWRGVYVDRAIDQLVNLIRNTPRRQLGTDWLKLTNER